MGAILGALIGRHLAHMEERHQAGREMAMAPVASYLKDPANSPFKPEDVDAALTLGDKMHLWPKDMMDGLKVNLEKGKKMWQAKQDLDAANRQAAAAKPAPGSQGPNLGVPNTNPGAAPPVTAQLPPPPFDPSANASMVGSQPATPSSAPPNASAIMQRLLPLVAAAKAQQTGGMQGNIQGPSDMAPPGSVPSNVSVATTPPFANGPMAAGASGPIQQGENPVMAQGAVKGGEGFNTPPPAAAGPPGLFPYVGRSLAERAGLKGQAEAIEALPGLRQTNALALEHQANLYQQTQGQRIAEQERQWNLIKADPAFDKLNPLQKAEMRARIFGVQGAFSNYIKPINLPQSILPGDEFPEGTLGLDGQPIDRSRSKWYHQQQDPVTNEVRAVAATPKLATVRFLTEAGPVMVSVDPRGDIFKVTKAIDGSPITDPRLLETVRTGLSMQYKMSVDTNGNPVLTPVEMPTGSTSQKVLPGQKGRAAAPIGTGGTATGTGTGQPIAQNGPAAPRLPRTNLRNLPQALTASTRDARNYAQTIQTHIPRIEELIDDLDKTGDLGIIASRWNEFLTGRLGGNPSSDKPDPRYAALRADMGMFQTALGVAHKVRGVKMMEHFKELADAGKMDYPTLKASIGELKSWVNTYANMGVNMPGAIDMSGGKGGNAMNNPPPKTPGGPDDLLKTLVNEYKNK